MGAKDFIFDELNAFIKRFTKTRIRYEYDQNALVHVVEVLPNEVYRLDENYINWENDFYNRFVVQFPCENICFVSDDALIGIENPELVIEGLEYAPITFLNETPNVFYTNVFNSMNKLFERVTYTEYNKTENFTQFNIPNTYIESGILKAA
jgi:hypothetical protein